MISRGAAERLLVPPSDTSTAGSPLKLPERRLFYWSVRFTHWDSCRYMAEWTEVSNPYPPAHEMCFFSLIYCVAVRHRRCSSLPETQPFRRTYSCQHMNVTKPINVPLFCGLFCDYILAGAGTSTGTISTAECTYRGPTPATPRQVSTLVQCHTIGLSGRG